MKRLLLLLLLPVYSMAQEVKPVLSQDYLDLINKDSLYSNGITPADTMNSIRHARFRSFTWYSGDVNIRKIVNKDNAVKLFPLKRKVLKIGGSFSSIADIKQVNQLPALQSAYVQGRAQNGALAWRGPETGELFSYGPALNTLEYDKSAYPYDINGRLVPSGSGSGGQARAYDNSIFRTGSSLLQSLTVQGRYYVNGRQALLGTIKVGRGRENLVLRNNYNTSNNFSASGEALIKSLTITGAYTTQQSRFSNGNRNGLLNRAYQQSLLTPASFDNGQGNTLGNGQRSYSVAGDNPWFLLDSSNNGVEQVQQTANLGLERRFGLFKFKVMQSLEWLRQTADETYKPGTAFFPAGITTNRKKNDANQLLNAYASYDIRFSDYVFNATASVNYCYGNNATSISYRPGTTWNYQRSSHDVAVNYLMTYRPDNIETGINLTNKIYASNTVTATRFFLPGISGYVRFDRFLDAYGLSLKLTGAYSRFNGELPVDRSFAGSNSLQYSTQQGLQYWPVLEATGIDHLDPIRHQEWTGRLEFSYYNQFTFMADVFNRKANDDIFPVYGNGALQLTNIASHRNKGIELYLNIGPGRSGTKKLYINNSVSFSTYRNKVTQVKDGYQNTPIAGFSNVYKAVVAGKALGVIMGSSYQRDAAGNVLIGNDGFPLVNNTPAVIGNPNPDFVVKMSNGLGWKNLNLDINWEWKKGGDVWNGTQAVLDYYGRSASAAAQRNTTNYVFAGVLSNGHANNIPVSFYDPALPVENNRWVRYGHSGVAEAYIQRADYIRLNSISLNYRIKVKRYLQSILLSAYAGNIILWTPYKGADPAQLFYDQSQGSGLDFFNLPSSKNFGVSVSLQF